MIDLGEGFREWTQDQTAQRLIRTFMDDADFDPAYSLGRIGSLEVRLATTKKKSKSSAFTVQGFL